MVRCPPLIDRPMMFIVRLTATGDRWLPSPLQSNPHMLNDWVRARLYENGVWLRQMGLAQKASNEGKRPAPSFVLWCEAVGEWSLTLVGKGEDWAFERPPWEVVDKAFDAIANFGFLSIDQVEMVWPILETAGGGDEPGTSKLDGTFEVVE